MFPVALATYLTAVANSVGGGVGFRLPEPPLAGGAGFSSSPDKGRAGEGFISFNLSFVNTPNPAISILETFFSSTSSIFSSGSSIGEEVSSVGPVSSGAGFLLLNGLNLAMKLVPSPPSPLGVSPREYRNTKNPTVPRIKIIIKSVKFLFDIPILKFYLLIFIIIPRNQKFSTGQVKLFYGPMCQ